VLPPRNKHYNSKFINTPVHVYFEEDDGVARRGAVIIDPDGSLTGSSFSFMSIIVALLDGLLDRHVRCSGDRALSAHVFG